MHRLPEAPFAAAMLAPAWLGDSVMSTALLPSLAAWSDGPVEVWARPDFMPLFEGLDSVSRVRGYDPKGAHRGLSGLWRWRRELRRAGAPPDLVWLVPDSFSSALAAWVGGTPYRLGRGTQGRARLLSVTLPQGGDRGRHWIQQQASSLALAVPGLGEGSDHLVPCIRLSREDRAAAAALLAEEGLDASSCCGFVAGASYGPAKRWPGFAELAERLPESLTILLLGAQADAEILAKLEKSIRERGRRCVNLCSRLEIKALAALFRILRFTVSNDSGPMHLAAAAGGRVLGLFASTAPEWTAPRGKEARFLDARPDCSPCFERSCPLPRMFCMDEIGAERVHAALTDWIDGEMA